MFFFVSRLTFFPKSYLALEKYVAVSRKNRGIGGTGQESRKLINSAPTATGFIFWGSLFEAGLSNGSYVGYYELFSSWKRLEFIQKLVDLKLVEE